MNRTVVKAGFTIVELAAVIAIISEQAAFAIHRFCAFIECSKAAESFSNFYAIQSAQECYYAGTEITEKKLVWELCRTL